MWIATGNPPKGLVGKGIMTVKHGFKKLNFR